MRRARPRWRSPCLRLLADKGLVHRDIAGFRQGFDMGPRLPVGGAGQLFSRSEFEPTLPGSAFSAAMIFSAVAGG